MRTLTGLLLLSAALLLPPAPAFARIKLTALPERERVEIQLDHGHFTLVEEERIVPLLESTAARGNNRVDFAWSNTGIDKDSIQFRPLAIREDGVFRPIRDGEVAVINVAYPPGENALVWEIYSREACALKVRVSYLIQNLTRWFSYRALADREETHLLLKSYLNISNYSGEDFGAAGVRAGFGPRFLKMIGQQEEMKILHSRFDAVPITRKFTFDWYAHGALNPERPYASKVLMHYQLVNDEENQLGRFPLSPGKVRVFMEDGRGGEAFLGEDRVDLTPLDGKMLIYLGEARDVVVTRTIRDNQRHPVTGRLFDQELWIRYEVENFKDRPVTLDIVEQLNRLAREYGADPHGEAEWEYGTDSSPGMRIGADLGGATPTLTVTLPARPKDPAAPVEKRTFIFHLTLKNLW